MSGPWNNTQDVMPERGKPIEWQDSGGTRVRGKWIGVWMMDSGVYVYYTPTLWRYV